jgi:hypothetical protein
MAHNDFYPLEIMRGSLSDVDYFLFKEDGTLRVTGKKATANCVVAIRGRVVSLRVKKGHSIAAGGELSYAYGRTADRLLE